MRWSSRCSQLVLVLLAVPALPAAQGRVWIVDDTPRSGADFASIQSAIDSPLVGDGDNLLVKPGSYTQLSLTNGKALTILADGPGVDVVASPYSRYAARIAQVPAGESVQLRGLSVIGFDGGLQLEDCSGTVWLEECRLLGGLGYTTDDLDEALVVNDCSDVILIKSEMIGGEEPHCTDRGTGGTGMEVTNSSVHAYGCVFRGGRGKFERPYLSIYCYVADAGDGVLALDATCQLFFSDCTLQGGDASCGVEFYGCHCAIKGVGLRLPGGAQAHVLDSTLRGGLHDPWDPCFGPTGAAFTGTPDFLAGRSLRVSTSSPSRENGTLQLHVDGPPFVPVWLTHAGIPGPTPQLTLLRGIELHPGGAASGSFFLGLTDASGSLDWTYSIGALPATWQAAHSFLQLRYTDWPLGTKVQSVPSAPKPVVLGQGSMIITLDSTF